MIHLHDRDYSNDAAESRWEECGDTCLLPIQCTLLPLYNHMGDTTSQLLLACNLNSTIKYAPSQYNHTLYKWHIGMEDIWLSMLLFMWFSGKWLDALACGASVCLLSSKAVVPKPCTLAPQGTTANPQVSCLSWALSSWLGWDCAILHDILQDRVQDQGSTGNLSTVQGLHDTHTLLFHFSLSSHLAHT